MCPGVGHFTNDPPPGRDGYVSWAGPRVIERFQVAYAEPLRGPCGAPNEMMRALLSDFIIKAADPWLAGNLPRSL
jgi:hypothetical protein